MLHLYFPAVDTLLKKRAVNNVFHLKISFLIIVLIFRAPSEDKCQFDFFQASRARFQIPMCS